MVLSKRRILTALIVTTGIIVLLVFVWGELSEQLTLSVRLKHGSKHDVVEQKARHDRDRVTRVSDKKSNRRQRGKRKEVQHRNEAIDKELSAKQTMHSTRNLLQRFEAMKRKPQSGNARLLSNLSNGSRNGLSTFGRSTLSCDKESSSLASNANTDIKMFIRERPSRARVNRTGYVLAVTFREQQTKASDNMIALQCWAKTLSVYIVEPYVLDSRLLFPMDASTAESNLLRFRDLFNVSIWQTVTTKHGFAPLAGWENFIADAPRDLIVVRFKYVKSFPENKEKGMSNHYKHGCIETEELSAKVNYLVSEHGFKVIREVCFNFEYGDQLTLPQFNRNIYNGIPPKTVTVLMEEWRGLSPGRTTNRVLVYDACWTEEEVDSLKYSWPSQSILCDAQKYREKYLQTDRYIALMVRTEKFSTIFGDDKVSKMKNIAYCLNKTLAAWKKLKEKTGVELTFLSIDVGSYGSTSLTEKHTRRNYKPFLHLYEDFLKQVYGPSATVESWESTFESITEIRDTGYIGSLQKTLVSQAECIVFSGGGSFQKHTKYMYDTLNQGTKKQCIQVVDQCSH